MSKVLSFHSIYRIISVSLSRSCCTNRLSFSSYLDTVEGHLYSYNTNLDTLMHVSFTHTTPLHKDSGKIVEERKE